jgi:hypothetical protein
MEVSMRLALIILPLSFLALAACGTTEEKTVVVQPTPGSTVVVPADGNTKVITTP